MESTHQFLVSVHIVVSLTLFSTTIVVKHMALSLTNLVIVSVGKDMEVFSQILHGQKNFILQCTCVLHQVLQQSNLRSQQLQRRCPHPLVCSYLTTA